MIKRTRIRNDSDVVTVRDSLNKTAQQLKGCVMKDDQHTSRYGAIIVGRRKLQEVKWYTEQTKIL